MAKAAGCRWSFFVALALVSGCSEGMPPVAPSPVVSTPAPAPAAPTVLLPGVAPRAGTYVMGSPSNQGWPSPNTPRYVVGDDGRFELQYPGIVAYRGTYKYSEETGLITFGWEGSSLAGPWGATGSVRDDVLTVRYNLIMQMSDFEDSSFTRVP